MRIGWMLAALLLTGCSAEASLKREVAATMKDPDSAKFGEVYIFTEGADRLACGTVNAKNSFGAYGGPTEFMVRGGLFYMPVSSHCCTVNIPARREQHPDLHKQCEDELPVPVFMPR